jgi:hypothetical protein
MLDYVYGYDEIVARFVAQLIPSCRERGFPQASKAIGIIKGVELIAGVVYHNYEPEAGIIEISGAALPGYQWVTRETLKRSYVYPFLTCGVQMIVQRTPAEDERLLGMLAALNYSLIKVPRMFGRDKDGVLCCLTYEAWVESKINKRFKFHLADPEQEKKEAENAHALWSGARSRPHHASLDERPASAAADGDAAGTADAGRGWRHAAAS